MHTIKCPNCHTMFELDDSIYMDIVKQVRDEEFDKEKKSIESYYNEKSQSMVNEAKSGLEKEIVSDMILEADLAVLNDDIVDFTLDVWEGKNDNIEEEEY